MLRPTTCSGMQDFRGCIAIASASFLFIPAARVPVRMGSPVLPCKPLEPMWQLPHQHRDNLRVPRNRLESCVRREKPAPLLRFEQRKKCLFLTLVQFPKPPVIPLQCVHASHHSYSRTDTEIDKLPHKFVWLKSNPLRRVKDKQSPHWTLANRNIPYSATHRRSRGSALR